MSIRNPRVPTRNTEPTARQAERGYTMLALILSILVSSILLTAAAPNVIFEAKRQREEELISRGEQVAEAIERFRRQTNRLPMDLDELVKGVTIGIKQQHFLRKSAASDPMVKDGKWRLVRPGDPLIAEFAQAWAASTGLPIPPQLAAYAGQPGISINLPGNQPGGRLGEGSGPDGIGPFVGVVSRSKERSIRKRFGLESYDKWLFIYIQPMPMQMMSNPGGITGPPGPQTPFQPGRGRN